MKYTYYFAALSIAASKKNALVHDFYSSRGAYMATKSQLKERPYLTAEDIGKILDKNARKNLDRDYEAMLKKGIKLVSYTDPDYPSRLKYNPEAPFALFYLGSLPKENGLKVGIVGARKCSVYGQTVSYEIGKSLGNAKVDVISGMALGVDCFSQRGALEGGGASFAVLGCGVDICYPASNRKLYEDLKERGGIISEYAPGTGGQSMFFPARNRIISGLSDAVVLVEARKRSGSLITADHALEQGRDIYCVPGRLMDDLSYGTNELIRQGAGIIVSKEGLLSDLGLIEDLKMAKTQSKLRLEKNKKKIYDSLSLDPVDVSVLIEKTGLPLNVLVIELPELCEMGLVKETFKNCYVRCPSK